VKINMTVSFVILSILFAGCLDSRDGKVSGDTSLEDSTQVDEDRVDEGADSADSLEAAQDADPVEPDTKADFEFEYETDEGSDTTADSDDGAGDTLPTQDIAQDDSDVVTPDTDPGGCIEQEELLLPTCNAGEHSVTSLGESASAYSPEVLALDGARSVVVWLQKSSPSTSNAIVARFYNGELAEGGSIELSESVAGQHHGPHAVVRDNEGFTVFWHFTDQWWDITSILGRQFDSNGNPIGDTFIVHQKSYTTFSVIGMDAAVLTDGSVLLVWDRDIEDILAKRFFYEDDPNVAPLLQVAKKETNAPRNYDPKAISLSNSGYIVIWTSANESLFIDVVARRFIQDDTPGEIFQINTTEYGSQHLHAVTTLKDGRIATVWSHGGENKEQNIPTYGVYAQLLSSEGELYGVEIQVVEYSWGVNLGQYLGKTGVSPLPDGGFTAFWSLGHSYTLYEGVMGAGPFEIVGQRLDPLGQIVDEPYRISNDTCVHQSEPSAALLNNGTTAVVWQQTDPEDSSCWWCSLARADLGPMVPSCN
jgi:hypothetical protein